MKVSQRTRHSDVSFYKQCLFLLRVLGFRSKRVKTSFWKYANSWTSQTAGIFKDKVSMTKVVKINTWYGHNLTGGCFFFIFCFTFLCGALSVASLTRTWLVLLRIIANAVDIKFPNDIKKMPFLLSFFPSPITKVASNFRIFSLIYSLSRDYLNFQPYYFLLDFSFTWGTFKSLEKNKRL